MHECMCTLSVHKYNRPLQVLTIAKNCTADLVIGPNPVELTSGTAFRIFPISDQYDMQAVHIWCRNAVETGTLELWPSAPIASSEVPKHPGLVQWLALADSKQRASLVDACLSQLLCQEPAGAFLHEAVTSPLLCNIIDGLRPETKTNIIRTLAGMPLGIQVLVKITYTIHACMFAVARGAM